MFKDFGLKIWTRYLLIKWWIKGDVAYNFKTKKWGLGRNESDKTA